MTNKFNYFIGNWKMFGDLSSIKILKKVNIALNAFKKNKFKVIFCIPHTLIYNYSKNMQKSKIFIGAQNVHYLDSNGAYTGSINSKMIKNVGAKYIIVGHSENRLGGDSDKIVNQKIKSCLKNKINVILCIGESKKDKVKKHTNKILKKQILKSLNGIKNINNIIFAYEPIWSIGTGKIPKRKELEKNIFFIKKLINNKFKKAKNIKILYGGSVGPDNISELSAINDLSGFLIGRSSQSSKKFIDIIKNWYK